MVDSERLREEAERILAQRRYRAQPTASEKFGEWVEQLWYRFVEFLGRIADLIGGPLVLGIILVVAVVIAVVLVTRNLGKRRAREIEQRIMHEQILARGADPAELERQAQRAAAHAEYSTALRLIFRAGLLRLDASGRIRYYPGLTSAEVAELLASHEFEALARRFDEVVYGHSTATAEDYERARQSWERLARDPVMERVG